MIQSNPRKIRKKTYFLSLCLGLGREYFRYPSQGTFLRPARTEIMSLTLSIKIRYRITDDSNTQGSPNVYSSIDFYVQPFTLDTLTAYNLEKDYLPLCKFNGCLSWLQILGLQVPNITNNSPGCHQLQQVLSE